MSLEFLDPRPWVVVFIVVLEADAGVIPARNLSFPVFLVDVSVDAGFRLAGGVIPSSDSVRRNSVARCLISASAWWARMRP